jgi:signal transduction histidine kinase
MPKYLTGQLISLIVFLLLSTQLLVFIIFLFETDFSERLQKNITDGIYLAQMDSAVKTIESNQLLDSYTLNSFRVKFYVIDEPLFDGSNLSKTDKKYSQDLQRKIGSGYENIAVQQPFIPQPRIKTAINNFFKYLSRVTTEEVKPYSPSVTLQGQVQLKNGKWLVMLVFDVFPYPTWITSTLTPLFIFTAILVIFASVIIVGITSPLNALTKEANKLGVGEKISEVKLRGPLDIQNVIIAFNAMLKRVTNVNDHRARALAAISHDIRTPLTSMRLQAEFIGETDIQNNIFKKIDEMEQICEATVTFALQDSWGEQSRVFDIVSLVDSLCSDLAEQSLPVSFELRDKIKFSGRPIALKRAVTNLIKNGVSYGESVQVFINKTEDNVSIHIVDNGKGIPQDKMELLFSPFERLESSRNRNSGGLGLGMAIARSVVRSHGGEIELKNTATKGLDATIVLPFSKSIR